MMKKQNGLAVCVAMVALISLLSNAQAKSVKDCTADWKADQAGMQARGVTEKAYVMQCAGPIPPAPEGKSAPVPMPGTMSTTPAPVPTTESAKSQSGAASKMSAPAGRCSVGSCDKNGGEVATNVKNCSPANCRKNEAK
jgi:hypothetical protein